MKGICQADCNGLWYQPDLGPDHIPIEANGKLLQWGQVRPLFYIASLKETFPNAFHSSILSSYWA